MLPETGISMSGAITYEESSSRTYRLDFSRKTVVGMTNELAAVIQAIYLILGTERYKYIIYGWDYGIELLDLIGQSTGYVQSELKRRITEALTWDSRITSVESFVFVVEGKRVSCSFLVRTIYGDTQIEKVVEI